MKIPVTKLAERSLQVLEAIEELVEELGRSPTYAEIAERSGLKTRGGARNHVHRLAAAGVVSFEPGQTRTVRVLRSSAAVRAELYKRATAAIPQ